jgi:hypothetical protein
MDVITKYPITNRETVVHLPEYHQIMDVQIDEDDLIWLYVLIDAHKPASVMYKVYVLATGEVVDNKGYYTTTIQHGTLVWHIFMQNWSEKLGRTSGSDGF